MEGTDPFRSPSELVAQMTELPARLLGPMARYLMAKGVLTDGDVPVASTPRVDRQRHAALLGFLKSTEAPAILKYVVRPTLNEVDVRADRSASGGLYQPPTPDFSALVRELKKDREFQVASLAPLERDDAAALFDHVVALLENPRPPRPRPMSDEPTWVPNPEHPWPRTGQVAWPEVLARVESDEIREDFRPVIAQHRATGYPDDVYILNAIQRNEQIEQIRVSLATVLELPTKTAKDCCRRWAALIGWGQRRLARTAPGSPIDLKDEVSAHASYGTPESVLSSPLLWATEAKAATVTLRPLAVDAGFLAADLIPLHALGRDLDRILAGEAIDIQPDAERVRLIVAEIEIFSSHDDALVQGTDKQRGAASQGASELGNGGPAKTFDAVCSTILKLKGEDAKLAEGDVAVFHDVIAQFDADKTKKPKDYMAPSGRLCTGGWITRNGDEVVLTDLGARDGERRRQRERDRRPKS